MGTEQGAKLKTHPGRKGAKESPGITAAQRGDLQALQQLPAEELLAARDHNGCSALHWAAGNGHLAVCEFLLQLDAAGIAATTWNQRTALHYAARNGRLEVCRWLVAAKSDANALARDEVSPLQLAVWQNHLDTCRWFVEAHADPLQRNRFGCSVAHWLSQAPRERAGRDGQDLIPLAEWLKSRGCDFAAVQEHGHNCLHKAAWAGHLELCRWLRDTCGLRDALQDHAGNFAADLAEMAGHQRLQAWLRSECSAARSISCAKLGLPEDADPAAIREAYLRLVRTVHPDSPLRLSEGYDEFSALHEAYRHLTKDQGQGNQSNPRHQERLMLQWDSQEPGFESEAQMFKSRLLTVVGEFGDKGLPLSSLRKKYAQALPAPTSFGLRKGCGLLEMLRHVAGDVLRVEMHARGQDPVLHADSTESKAVSWGAAGACEARKFAEDLMKLLRSGEVDEDLRCAMWENSRQEDLLECLRDGVRGRDPLEDKADHAAHQKDKDWWTPLHWAAQDGHERLAEKLLALRVSTAAVTKLLVLQPHAMDDALKAEIIAVRCDEGLQINRKCQVILSKLQAAGLLWEQKVKPVQLLVHPSNRSGAMLNSFDMHAKGAMVLTMGCLVDKLSDSLAFEMAKEPGQKQTQLQANLELVSASENKIAPVLSTERYLTVACSHVGMFLKTVAAGTCSTEHEELARVNNGLLTLDSLLSKYADPVLEALIKEGWTWTVISAEVEEHLEWLPGFLQGSLNTSQQVASTPTEMEQAMSLAFWYSRSKDLDVAIAQTAACMPLRAHYVPMIAQWVAKYGGGEEFPLVKLAESISADKLEVRYSWRRLLSKTDVDKLKGQAFGSMVSKAELLLVNAWNLASKTPCLAWDKKCLALGRFMCRLVLFMLNKQAKGREKKSYDSLEQINTLFSEDWSAMVKDGKIAPAALAASGAASSGSKPPVPLQNTADPKFIAMSANPHLEVGKCYTNAKYPGQIFKFTEMQASFAKMTHAPLFGSPVTVDVQHDELKTWKVCYSKEPALIDGSILTKMQPANSEQLQVDKAKAVLQTAIYDLYLEQPALESSKPEIAKLVCGSSCRLPKNASLANGAKMQELKAKRLAAWQNVCLEEAEQESFAELVARLQVAGPEPDMEAMENTGTSPVATDAAEEDKAAKAEEEMADATETEVAPAKKSQEESWPEQEKGQEESRPEQEEGWVWKEGQWAWCMGRQEWAWLKSQWVWLEEQVAWAQPQWVWPSGAGDWVWRDAMWVQLQAPEDKPYPTERGWQPHAGMIMPQEWQGQWFVPPSPASGEEEDPSSQAVQDEVMEDYGSEEGKAKSFLEVLRMQEEAEEEERAAKRQKFTEKSTGSNPQKPNANQIYPQDKKKINRGSGWKMKTVPLVAHVMNEDWGQAKAAARSMYDEAAMQPWVDKYMQQMSTFGRSDRWKA
ncbi:unnamed protein product [Effrenium voratum]|uniref:J domain-containing protein n=1 Tax=Effrenium voratum TaxID=2562239 RepID=A0AA36IJE7_9DINO|nr:unnamed protein product [Effrenium voratum]